MPPMNSNPFGDPRARTRHQSLMQDFKELNEETQAMRRKLEAMRERKAILMAEVRFLRRRYRLLNKDQPMKRSLQTEQVLPTILETKGRTNDAKSKKQSRKPQVSHLDLNSEAKVYQRNEATERPISLPDINQSERVRNANENTVKRRVPIFDLNQILGEKEEAEGMGGVEVKSSSGRRESTEVGQQIERKLAGCRNSGNGTNSKGKRKISWQDPVALRV